MDYQLTSGPNKGKVSVLCWFSLSPPNYPSEWMLHIRASFRFAPHILEADSQTKPEIPFIG